MSKGRIVLAVLAAAAAALSLLNASWIAPKPVGRLDLLARHGVALPVEREAAAEAPCTARLAEEPGHMLIENTMFALHNAVTMGAQGFALDVHGTEDKRGVIFRDAVLDCRTDGSGAVADRSLEELKRLDVGYGYTADGGATFPLRGRGIGGMLTVEEVLRAHSDKPLLFVLRGPTAADAVVAAFRRMDVPIGDSVGFAGDAAALARLRRLTPGGWLLDRAASDSCFDDYFATGWTGMVPESCAGRTLAFPLEGRSRWTIWGWPYRFLERIAESGSRMLILSEYGATGPVGLERAEQLGEVPRAFKGLLLVEDMYGVGRALER